MHLRKVAVEISTENLAAGIEAIAAQTMLEFVVADRAMVLNQPATCFLASLIAVDLDELTTELGGAEQIGVGTCDGFRRKLDGAFTGVKLLGHRRMHHLLARTGVVHPGVIRHAQSIALRIDAPVPLVILLPEIVLGRGCDVIIGGELPHAGTSADVAGHDGDGGFVDQQAAFDRGKSPALGFVEKTGDAAVEILQLHRVGHAAEPLEGFADRTHIAEVDVNLDQAALETFIAAQFEHQLIAVHPAAPGIAHLDADVIAIDAVGAFLLTFSGGSDPDVAHAAHFDGVQHNRKPVNQVRLNDGSGSAAHHGQVHHQPEGLPVHKIGGRAVVGAGKIFRLFNPAGTTDPQPTTRRQSLLFGLHASQQLHFAVVQLTQLAQAFQVAGANLAPAFTTLRRFTAVGPIKNGVGCRGRSREISEAGGCAGLGLHTIRCQGHVR
ncbi:MAG: Uncharacterised protein [Synechococcus sp. CC9902]|nr:MAG: Uncharacterised protein [Synechococcus sp. CC9902]